MNRFLTAQFQALQNAVDYFDLPKDEQNGASTELAHDVTRSSLKVLKAHFTSKGVNVEDEPVQFEVSHVVQWIELTGRAKNFDLEIGFNTDGFILRSPPVPSSNEFGNPIAERFWQRRIIGHYQTLADLRAGISDWVAEERRSGRMKT